jgi:hypothetical protein
MQKKYYVFMRNLFGQDVFWPKKRTPKNWAEEIVQKVI